MGILGSRGENGSPLRLGELALKAGLLTQAQLKQALALQEAERKTGRLPRQLGLILLSSGFLAEVDLIKILSEQEKQRAAKGMTGSPSPQTRLKDGAGPTKSHSGPKKPPTLLLRPKD